jgi:glycerophosphoryl diester phosphodiesterase
MKRKFPKVIAHRGGRKWGPENTLAVFSKCVEAGFDGIELDVHRAKTGELVVLHFDDLTKTTSGKGLVKNISLARLKKLSAGAWFSPEFAHERVPTLKEVLDLVAGRLVINVEVKNAPDAYPGIEDDLIELLDAYGYGDKIIVSSFDHDFLKRFVAKTNAYKTGLLINGLLLDLPAYAAEVGTAAWHPQFVNLRADQVKLAKRAGIEVNVWTLNEVSEWDSAVRMGVDGIVTDDPEGLGAYLDKLRSGDPMRRPHTKHLGKPRASRVCT